MMVRFDRDNIKQKYLQPKRENGKLHKTDGKYAYPAEPQDVVIVTK